VYRLDNAKKKNLLMDIYTNTANTLVSLTHPRNSITESWLIWELCHKLVFNPIMVNSKELWDEMFYQKQGWLW